MSQPNLTTLRDNLRAFLGHTPSDQPVAYTVLDERNCETYKLQRVEYLGVDGDTIPAYLLIPSTPGRHPAVIVHHQHNSEWHYGKSEVCGLVGDPMQAFGPALAKRGCIVLAPDAICFEDRRHCMRGTEPDPDNDWNQHFNEYAHRLSQGHLLMTKILADANAAVCVLRSHPDVDPQRIGALGHSFGGNTVLFHSALDERITFACASGAAASYRHRFKHRTGIEMSQIIPGFASRFEITDLVRCIAPRPCLLASTPGDRYSADADRIAADAAEAYDAAGAPDALEQFRVDGAHALTYDRFDRIVNWVLQAAGL
jgi:dienelactone hydrolase